MRDEGKTVMTPEEAKIIRDVFERLKGMGPAPQDADAQRAIETELKANPDAAIGLVRAVVALDQERSALMQDREQSQKRIADLEQQLANAGRGAPQPGGGLFGSNAGGYGQPPAQRGPWGPQPVPQQPDPGPQQGGPWGGGFGGGFGGGQSGGQGSFLGSAMRTAAGVAGGMFAFEALKGLFGGHSGGMFGGAPVMGQPVVQETIIEHIPVYDRVDGPGPFGLASSGNSGGFETGGGMSDDYDVASGDFGGDDDYA